MGIIKVKYLVKRRKKGKLYLYWVPRPTYVVGGKEVKCPYPAQPLPANPVEAHRKAEELNDILDAWRNGAETAPQIEEGTVSWLIIEYRKDARYDDLRASTRTLYGYNLEIISRHMGPMPITEVTRVDARTLYQSFESKHKGQKVVQVARVLFNMARDMDIIQTNPFDKMRLAHIAPRSAIWNIDTQEAAKNKALEMGMPSIALAIQLGLDIGQRSGDLRALSWHQYNGATISLRQQKTGVMLEVPVMRALKKMLDATERKSPVVLICEATGKPYSKDMLSRRVREVCEAAGIGKDIQFRDLRRTAVVRLAEHGCETAEICAITGHTLKSATEILEVYLPRTSKMAQNAIHKLEAGK